MWCVLAGGVGGARMAHGVYQALPPSEVAVVVNVGDDFELLGLWISPDVDTVLYTLAGLSHPEQGWGLRDETFAASDMLVRYGEDMWFKLGDRDLATHILRTEARRRGRSLCAITADLAQRLGVRCRLLPATDARVPTVVATEFGVMDFQDYFVRRKHQDTVREVRYHGAASAVPAPEVLDALRSADGLLVAPSNPILSIGPMLAMPQLRAAVQAVKGPKIAVSPIIGGAALKGPADRLMRDLQLEVSPLGVARYYGKWLDGIVIDRTDADLRAPLEAEGWKVLVTDTVMRNEADRRRLAEECIAFGGTL